MRFFMFHYRPPLAMDLRCGLLRMFAEHCGPPPDCGLNNLEDPQTFAGLNRRAPRRESRGAL